MNEYKINTDIISTTGIAIDTRNMPTSTGKIVINNVEVTDIDSWNKAISTFSELENKINNLQSKIDKAIEILEKRKKYIDDEELTWVEMPRKDYFKEIEEIEDALKEDK